MGGYKGDSHEMVSNGGEVSSTPTATERVVPNERTCAQTGRIVFEPIRAAWLVLMTVGGVIGVGWYFSWSALVVFVCLSGLTLCAGHSVGMHRLLIHRSFKAEKWLERTLVYLGVLVGMAGPMGMIRAHDMRDWHQRQLLCPPHPSHGAGFFKDAYWQLCCRFELNHPPHFSFEPDVRNDRFYQWLETNWMAQQIPLAIVLTACGGISWLLFGICLRVSVSLIGHWVVGHIAHKHGTQGWAIAGLPVQGYNVPHLGLITFGENWHGNHHAFPHSAQLGIERGQSDPGYGLIRLLHTAGLATDIRLPHSEPPRQGLFRVVEDPHYRGR